MKFPNTKTEKDFDAHFQSEIWREIANQICLRHQISFDEIKRANSSDHIVFLIDENLILKIFRPFRNCFKRELQALEFVKGKIDFRTPKVVEIGEFEGFDYLFTTQISGELVTREMWLNLNEKEQISFIQKLAVGLKQIHSLNADSFADNWAEFIKDRAETFIERQIAHGVNQQIIRVLPKFIEENLPLVPTDSPNVFMHSDIHFGNLRVLRSNNSWQIAGIFDFADSRRGFHEYDFLAVGVLMIQGQAETQREFFKAYGYLDKDLDETMRKRMMMMTMLYESADLRRYAMRLKPEAVDYSLQELEKGIWSFVS